MRIEGKYRSIEFDGKKVTIRARVGRSLIASLNSEVENSFRVKQIQSIEHRKPANGWDVGLVRFTVSGREPEIPRNLPAMAAKIDMNSYSYGGKDTAAVAELIDAIESSTSSSASGSSIVRPDSHRARQTTIADERETPRSGR